MNLIGRAYVKTRDSFRRFSGFSHEEEIVRFQNEAISGRWPEQTKLLDDILRFAARHVPYYAEVAAGLGDAARDLSCWPALTKDIMRKAGDALKSDDHRERDVLENSSGGSSGRPVRFIHDRLFRDRAEATRRYHTEHVMGLNRNMSQVILWGSERDIFDQGAARREPVQVRLKNWTLLQLGMKSTVLNAFRMSQIDMDRYLDTINQERPEVIHAYAGSLYQLARHARDRGVRMHSPYRIYTTAETLRPFMREMVEHVFKTHVYDFYGSREVGPIAGEGPGGQLFTFDFFNLVEVVDADNRPVAPGQPGRILVTTLHNRAMPFIRYEIGDMAVRGQPSTILGHQLGALEKVSGRITDQFVTASGTHVHGEYFTHLFYFCEFVDEFQVTQTDVNSITISYVPIGRADDGVVAEIERKIRLVMGEQCRIDWQSVEQVPRTPQGKLLYTRSLVWDWSVGSGDAGLSEAIAGQ